VKVISTNAFAMNESSPFPSCSPEAQEIGADLYFSYSIPPGVHRVTFMVDPMDQYLNDVLFLQDTCGAAATELACHEPAIGRIAPAFTLVQTGPARFFVGVNNLYGDVGGRFRLDGRIGTPTNEVCDNARPILLSDLDTDNSIFDTTRFSSDDYGSANVTGCMLGSAASGGDLVYAFTFTGATPRTVAATIYPEAGYDPLLYRFEGSCAPTACAAAVDFPSDSEDDVMTWVAQPNTTYWLVVDGYDTNLGVGAFRLEVK
jgi:hypothetical protein